MKQRLLRALRQVRLLPLVESLNAMKLRLRARAGNRHFQARLPNEPLPPTALMIDPYGYASYEGYWESGRESAVAIARAAERVLPPTGRRTLRVLDWGCGPARIIRHLPTFPIFAGVELHGCDCNRQAVAWAQERISTATFVASDLLPPLPYADASFDLLYGISIFTHLSAENHGRWIAELRRVLRPGGRALLTFQGNAFKRKLLPDELIQFERGELVIRDNIEEGSRLYCAFHPTPYLHRLFADGFDEIAVWEEAHTSIAPPQVTVSARRKD